MEGDAGKNETLPLNLKPHNFSNKDSAMTATILKKSIFRPAFSQPKAWLAAGFAISVCLAGLAQPVASQSTSTATLAQLFKGFETCSVDREALRFKPGRNAEYLQVMSKNKPFRVAQGLAWFRVADSYRGLPVRAVAVPADGSSQRYGLVFGATYSQAKNVLTVSGLKFAQDGANEQHNQGPGLVTLTADDSVSMLVCGGVEQSAAKAQAGLPVDYMLSWDGVRRNAAQP